MISTHNAHRTLSPQKVPLLVYMISTHRKCSIEGVKYWTNDGILAEEDTSNPTDVSGNQNVRIPLRYHSF